MGREPANFVPVKYGSGIEEENQTMKTILLLWGLILLYMFGKRHAKNTGSAHATKKTGSSGSSWGGMNDLMGMSKAQA